MKEDVAVRAITAHPERAQGEHAVDHRAARLDADEGGEVSQALRLGGERLRLGAESGHELLRRRRLARRDEEANEVQDGRQRDELGAAIRGRELEGVAARFSRQVSHCCHD